MGFPLINKQPIRQINIPDLSGGINLRDAIYSVNDNQLTDCKNVWFKDGMLKTRPGSYKVLSNITAEDIDSRSIEECKTRIWDIYRTIGGYECRLATFCIRWYEAGLFNPAEYRKTYFIWVANLDDNEIMYPEINDELQISPLETYNVKTVIEYAGEIFVFTENWNEEFKIWGTVYKWIRNSETDVWEWKRLSNTDLYIPTVMTDCKCGKIINANNFSSAPGEAYNKINDLCKIKYSTVNLDLLSASDENSFHCMSYFVPISGLTGENFQDAAIIERIKSTFKVEIIYQVDGKYKAVEHTFAKGFVDYDYNYPDLGLVNTMYEVEPNATVTDGNKSMDGLYLKGFLRPDGGMDISLFLSTEYSAIKTVTASDYIRNDMTITIPCIMDKIACREIFESTISTWYGGEASGIFGGTRLFVAGGAKNKVIYSDLNNPLYFPEDCDMDVGNKDEMITAFGKQNEQLIIFKEHSVWGSNYVFNSDITGESLIAQTVVNYEANTAYFPLIQLHPQIGCRVPNSVQLCRNRLVWADENGKVYTLVSQSQYNERNVYELSDMIEKRLKALNKEELINATSADYDGHYVLCVGNKLFVMDYNCYGYTHCYSYSKTEDGQKLIPWWYFEIPLTETETVEGIFSINQNLYYWLSDTDQKHNFSVYCFDDNMTTDEGKAIESLIETKCFSFGTFSYTKHISALNMALNGSGDIRITYISDKPELISDEILSLYSDDTEIGSPSYMQNVLFRPNMRFTALFGIRLETESGIAVGPISLNYRLLGGNN